MTHYLETRTHSSAAIGQTHQTRPSHFKIGHEENSFVDGLAGHTHAAQYSCILVEKLRKEPSYANSRARPYILMGTCSWHVKSCWLRIKRHENSPASRSPIVVDGTTMDHSTNGLMANSIEFVEPELKCSWVTPGRFTRCGSTHNRLPLGSDSSLITHQIVSHHSSLFQIHLKVSKTAKHLTCSNQSISWHRMGKTLLGQGYSSCVCRTRTQGTQGSLTLTKDSCL